MPFTFVYKHKSNADVCVIFKHYVSSEEELQAVFVEAILREEEEIARKNKAKGKREMNRQHIQHMVAKGYTLPIIADLLGLSESDVQTFCRSLTLR